MSEHNKYDKAIDDTLATLRSVEAPASLEHRLLNTLEQHARAHTRATQERSHAPLHNALAGRRFTSSRPRQAALLGACVLLLAALTSVAVHHPDRARVPIAGTRSPSSIHSAPQPAIVSPSTALHMPLKPVPRHTGTRAVPAHAAPHLPSFSAPQPVPVPLTEQERLLQQIAHSGDPSQFDMLNPEVLARQEADRDAEFRQFFAPEKTQNP